MSIFGKPGVAVESPTPNADTTNVQLNEKVESMAQQLEQILAVNSELIKANAELKAKQEAISLENELKSYCSQLGISSDGLKTSDSVESKYKFLLEQAVSQVSQIKASLKEGLAGNFSSQGQDDKFNQDTPAEAVGIEKAMEMVKKEKPELKGEALINYAHSKYPEAFNIIGQYKKIKEKLSTVGGV